MITIAQLPDLDLSKVDPVFQEEKDNMIRIASTIDKMKKAGLPPNKVLQETLDDYLSLITKAIALSHPEKKSPAGRKITPKKTRKRGGGTSKPVKHEKPKPTVPTASHKAAGAKKTFKTVKHEDIELFVGAEHAANSLSGDSAKQDFPLFGDLIDKLPKVRQILNRVDKGVFQNTDHGYIKGWYLEYTVLLKKAGKKYINRFKAKSRLRPVKKEARKPVKKEEAAPIPAAPKKEDKKVFFVTIPKTEQKQVSIPAALKMDAASVRKLSPEIFFLKRNLALHNRVKAKSTILKLIHEFQDALATGEIKKGNPWKAELKEMQDKLVNTYNKLKDKQVRLDFSDDSLKKYVAAVGSEKVYPSILMIRRFIAMQGKSYKPVFVANMAKNISGLLANKNVKEEDPFVSELKAIGAYLNSLNTSGSMNIIIKPAVADGLGGPSGLGRLAGVCKMRPQSARCKAIFSKLHARNEYDKELSNTTPRAKKMRVSKK